MMHTLNIWWDGQIVGHLTQNQPGELGFAYAPDWLAREDAPALSASLPKRAEPFSRRECRPFFGGLLPKEGQRDAVAQALGVSRANDFALLAGEEGLRLSLAGAQSKVPVVLQAVALPVPGQLLVQRHDRMQAADGTVQRIHQEDFCQALGVPPETKYASEDGPTFKDCFALLRDVAGPARGRCAEAARRRHLQSDRGQCGRAWQELLHPL